MTYADACAHFGGKSNLIDQSNRHFPNLATLTPDGSSVTLTPEGLDYLEELDRQRQQQADEEARRMSDYAHADENTQKHFRHDWRIAIFEALSGFILGAIADHFFDIIGNAARLWRFLFH